MFKLIEHDSLLGWRMKANLNEKFNFVDVENIPVRSNSLGFWDGEFSFERAPARCHIAFLGDSFTWGAGVGEEERFTNLLRETNPRWETLNFGVSGYGTDQTLLLWQSLAHSFRPDVVVLTVYQNDYQDNMYVVRYGRRKPYFELREGEKLELKGVPVPPIDFWNDGIFNQAAPPYESFFQKPKERRSKIVHWLAKNSDLVRFVYTRWRDINVEAAFHRHPEGSRDPSAVARPQDDAKRQVELLIALVTQLAKEVESTDAKFIVVFAGDLTPQHQMTIEALKTMKIAILDATSAVLARQISGPKESVYYRFSKHWTPSAHRAVSDVLSLLFKEKGICDVAAQAQNLKT